MRRRFGLAGAFAAYGITVATFASRAPSIKAQLDLSAGELSVALLGMPLGLILAMRFVARIVARRSSAWLVRASLVAVAICLPLPGLADGLAALCVALVALGLALGALDVAMNTQGVGLEGRLDRPFLSTLHGVYGIGFVVAAWAGSAAASAGLSPAAHFALAALALLALDVLLTPGLVGPEADETPAGEAASSNVSLRDHPVLIVVGAIGFCCFLAEGAVTDWSGVYLHEVQGATLGFAPLGAAAFGVGITAGRFLSDVLIARVGRAPVLPRAAAIGAAGMLLAILAPSPPVAVAGYAVLGLGVAPIVPICFTLAGTAPGVPPAWALARVTTIAYLGLFLGPPVVGGLAELTGLGVALGVVVALLLAVIGLSRSAGPRGAAPRRARPSSRPAADP